MYQYSRQYNNIYSTNLHLLKRYCEFRERKINISLDTIISKKPEMLDVVEISPWLIQHFKNK